MYLGIYSTIYIHIFIYLLFNSCLYLFDWLYICFGLGLSRREHGWRKSFIKVSIGVGHIKQMVHYFFATPPKKSFFVVKELTTPKIFLPELKFRNRCNTIP